jgi:glutathione S-transferase
MLYCAALFARPLQRVNPGASCEPSGKTLPGTPASTTMKLIGSTTSPYVRKVRVVMTEKKLDYQFVLEDVWSDETTIGDSNPLRKVPCLVMEDGGAVFDSRVIVEYLDTMSPVGRLIPASGRERAEVKCWEALADGLSDAAILLRLENSQRAEGERSAKWVARQRAKVDGALLAMSSGLGEGPWCAGSHYSLADIAVGCALAWVEFRFPDLGWRDEFPNLSRLVDKLHERPSFRDTAMKT